MQRNNHQPSRHFSPEKQQLELPILKNANVAKSDQKKYNELKTALNTTYNKITGKNRYRQGSLYDNYYKQIEEIKRKHHLNNDDYENEKNGEFIYSTQDQNYKRELANALFNFTQPNQSQTTNHKNTSYIQYNNINNNGQQQLIEKNKQSQSPSSSSSPPPPSKQCHNTSFNLHLNLWNSQLKQQFINSSFALAPVNNKSNLNNKKNNINNNLNKSQFPITSQSFMEQGSGIKQNNSLNLSYNNSTIRNNNYNKKNKSVYSKTQQSSLSPNKSISLDPDMILKDINLGSQIQNNKKKILEIDFTTTRSMNKKYNNNLKDEFQIIKTPYIDKAISIIEEKKKLNDNDDNNESFQYHNYINQNNKDESERKKSIFAGTGGGTNNNINKDDVSFIKIDGGYGDYILRYHHIKSRIQNKLIPLKVPQPELLNIFNTYQEYENDLNQSSLLNNNIIDPTPSHAINHNLNQQEGLQQQKQQISSQN